MSQPHYADAETPYEPWNATEAEIAALKHALETKCEAGNCKRIAKVSFRLRSADLIDTCMECWLRLADEMRNEI